MHMPETYVRQMLQRDIEEKDHIKRTINKLTRLQLIVSIIGILLVAAFIYNTYVTSSVLHEILRNRVETIHNRAYGDTIIRKLDSLLR